MENLPEIIGRNIEEMRASRGISKTELAQLIAVSRPTLDGYLKGRQIIDSGKLAVLAREFDKPLDFFLSSSAKRLPPLMFRVGNAGKAGPKLIDGVARRFQLYADLLIHFPEQSAFNPPTYTVKLQGQKELAENDKKAIERIAQKIRRGLSVEGADGCDLFVALEEAGINIVASATDPEAELWGASAFSHDLGAYIYVNDDLKITEERKIFSLIHELGHLVLHRGGYMSIHSDLKYAGKEKDINEKMADHFASCFLLPKDRIEKEQAIIGENISYNDIMYLKNRYKVSFIVAVRALTNHGFISQPQARGFEDQLHARGYIETEPKPLPYFEKSNRYSLLVRNLYRNGSIGLNKVAEYLGISLIETRKTVKEWGGNS